MTLKEAEVLAMSVLKQVRVGVLRFFRALPAA
jgi:hypothetical protein